MSLLLLRALVSSELDWPLVNPPVLGVGQVALMGGVACQTSRLVEAGREAASRQAPLDCMD